MFAPRTIVGARGRANATADARDFLKISGADKRFFNLHMAGLSAASEIRRGKP